MHVIGDAAAESGLEAFEKAFGALGGKEKVPQRSLLTHCQILRPDLIERMAECELVANIQPQFVVTDSRWVDEKVSKDLLPSSYAWKTLAQKGIRLAGGSDAPVEVPNPLAGIHAAMYRPMYNKSGDKKKFESWMPQECLSKEQAFALYTVSLFFGENYIY